MIIFGSICRAVVFVLTAYLASLFANSKSFSYEPVIIGGIVGFCAVIGWYKDE